MNNEHNPYRKKNQNILSSLSDFSKGYTVDTFISDFIKYFDEDIDFNSEKIREYIETSDKLQELIKKAKENHTHPVIEFVRDLFRELGKSGDVEWSGEL